MVSLFFLGILGLVPVNGLDPSQNGGDDSGDDYWDDFEPSFI